jgi:hypothetical protein
MEGKKKLKIPEKRFFHILRHFSEIDKSYKEILFNQGFDNITLKQECELVGSKFDASHVLNPKDILLLIDKGRKVSSIEQQNGNAAYTVELDYNIGNEGVISVFELTEEEKTQIKESPRGDSFLKSIKLSDYRKTNQITFVVNINKEIVSVFPGRYAPPLPFHNMTYKEKKISNEFWINHVFIDI